MEFTVNGRQFCTQLDLSDSMIIQSSQKNYRVAYSQKTLDDLIGEFYCENDFIIIDRNVYNLSPATFVKILDRVYIFDATEKTKTIESVLELIDQLLEKKITRANKLLVVGGGITQEIGGFASAIYKRGIPWVLIPTTILAMTDSCIGSKVSINRQSKNMLGLFVAPDQIAISDYFLKSLQPDDIVSGLGEALKLSLIGGQIAFDFFKSKYQDRDYLSIIKIATIIKKTIIEFDEFEKNERKVLNYGHTIGHALESTSNYTIPHGIAVLMGIYIKNRLFYPDRQDFVEINQLILELVDRRFFEINFDYSEFISHILSDKKNIANRIAFIILPEIGKSLLIYKDRNEFESNLKSVLKNIFANYFE
jgi:3-dehydroquinate synthase